MPSRVTAAGLFKWGIALLVVTCITRIGLYDVLLRLDSYVSPTSQHLGWLSIICQLISQLSLAVGASLVAGGLVVKALDPSRSQDGDGSQDSDDEYSESDPLA